MNISNYRSIVIYGKPQDELIAAINNLPVGRSVEPEQGANPIKLTYGDDSIYLTILPNGTLQTVNVLPQDLTSDVLVPLSKDKLQLLTKDLETVGVSYSWEMSENDFKSLG